MYPAHFGKAHEGRHGRGQHRDLIAKKDVIEERRGRSVQVRIDLLTTRRSKIAFVTYQRNLSANRSEEHTSELQSRLHLVCRLLLEKKKNTVSRSDDSYLCLRTISLT